MKIIQLYKTNEERLIKKAKKEDRRAQKMIYEQHSPKMLSVCRMYIKDLQYAEDVMLKGFFKVFQNIKQFEGKGSFEGWIRRIMIREAIDFLRVKKNKPQTDDYEIEVQTDFENPFKEEETQYIQALIDELPEGYRTVFVLYIVEEYKHKEIAKLLGISESTSRSQLTKAREILREEIKRIQRNELEG